MNHSSTLGYSPYLPVSVYGTGTTNKLRRFSWQPDYPDYLFARRLRVLSEFSFNGRIYLPASLPPSTYIRLYAQVSLLRHASA